jgi:peptidoglycan/LPS O-acetylase OafA/YrhL
MFYIPTLLFIFNQHFNISPIVQKIIETAGNITYSSYLMNFPLQQVIALNFLKIEQKIPYYSAVFFSGFILLTLIISYYTYRFFEMPTQKYIRKKLAIS